MAKPCTADSRRLNERLSFGILTLQKQFDPMTPHQWFDLANPIALLGWLLLVASLFTAQQGAWAKRLRLVGGRALPLALCVGYAAALFAARGSAPGGNFQSLSGVATLFASPGVLLAGWVHYLAFDLLVGRAIVDDAHTQGVSRWAVLPCLPLTFMFGPVGVLAYLAVRNLKAWKPRHAE
jgi:hypothetical protein